MKNIFTNSIDLKNLIENIQKDVENEQLNIHLDNLYEKYHNNNNPELSLLLYFTSKLITTNLINKFKN